MRHSGAFVGRHFMHLGLIAAIVGSVASARPALAADPRPGPPMTIQRLGAPVSIDGDLSDPGWKGLPAVTTWFETRVADSGVPAVHDTAWLAYDDHYFYAAFRFDDPHPAMIRAPIGDHDAISGATDYGGVLIDSHDDGKTAQMFLANAHGVQYDAITNDATGEDSSPDFYWDAAGKITPTGWNLEIRIPFSSLRYNHDPAPIWRIMLYRNYPRDRHYQFFSSRLPRDVSCFICNSSKLVGLANLPHGTHLVLAPYSTAQRTDVPAMVNGVPALDASSLVDGPVKSAGGFDAKWSPSANLTLDGTFKPDFSQIESDAAQIVANERFAIFFPEKRSFFLEGVDLFSTPLQAVYTRTITTPQEGARVTGRIGSTAYTALITRDLGGGRVVLPGPQGSDDAPQEFRSDVGIVRVRHDVGQSFVSALISTREIEGGGYNRVVGPDFQWRPRTTDTFTGQALYSQTQTPRRPDLAQVWDGRRLEDHAWLMSWAHNAPHADVFLQGQDLGPGFRADNGSIAQVGYRDAYLESGYTVRSATAFVSRARFWTIASFDAETAGRELAERTSAGFGLDARWNSFFRLEANRELYRVGDTLLQRFRHRVMLQVTPGRVLNYVSLDTYFGTDIDFSNAREGHGATIVGQVIVRPNDHLALQADASDRWLDVNPAGGRSGRLFVANVARLKTTWSFSSRSFVRLIGQFTQTRRDSLQYAFPVSPRSADFGGSALFAYKVNWQTVFYAGYGDARTFVATTDRLEPSGRQFFTKLSYSLQQ
jgi:hypothetical protein